MSSIIYSSIVKIDRYKYDVLFYYAETQKLTVANIFQLQTMLTTLSLCFIYTLFFCHEVTYFIFQC